MNGAQVAAEAIESERIRRAEKLAYATGRREADVDAHIRSHENRLNAINGSIEKAALNSARLEQTAEARFDAIDAKLDGLISTNAARDAVEIDRVAQVKQANDKQISRRAYWIGVISIIVAIAALMATVLIGTHVI